MMIRRRLLFWAVACGVSPALGLADEGTLDANGVKIHYVTAGSGEPVVLIHGWMADSTMWGRDASGKTKLDVSKAEGFHLIAFDCRGHGQSDKPHDIALYGEEMSADVVRLLDHLGLERAHLIGYSSGSFIAGHVAATHPDRVLSVVYGGQAPIVSDVDRPETSEVEVFAKAVDEGKDLSSYILAVTPPDKPKPSEAQAKIIAAFMFSGKDVKALSAAGRSFGKLRVTLEQLQACKAPTLFIHGGNESDTVQQCVANLRASLGRGELRVIEGADHMTTLINPEFGEAILEFLRSAREQ